MNIHLPDGSVKIVHYAGNARISKHLFLKDVLLVPGFKHNLILVAQLVVDSVARCTFLPSHCLIQGKDSDKILGIAKMIRNLYVIEGVVENYYCNLFDPRKMTIQQWHVFLGHPSLSTMRHLEGISEKFTESVVKELEQCDVCLKAKHCREPFPVLERMTDNLFELIHVDIWGSYSEDNICSTKFMLTIVEDFSRVTWTFMLDNKGEVYKVFIAYVKMIQTQFDKTIKVVRSDNGSEFLSNRFILLT